MFTFTRSDAQRIAVSAVGALFFSAVGIGGAIAPAQAGAATPSSTTAAWQRDTARRIDTDISVPAAMLRSAVRNIQIGVMVAPDGTVSSPAVLQSSGSRSLDRALMRRVAAMRLAPLPAAHAPRPVVLRVPLRDDRWAQVRWPNPAQYAAK